MSYTIPSIGQSDSNRYGRDGAVAIKELIVEAANANILQGKGERVDEERVFYAGQAIPLLYPCIRIETLTDTEQFWTMGGEGSGERRIDLTYLLTVIEHIQHQEDASESLTILVDRVRDLFSRNRTLDGFCEDLLVRPVDRGFFNPAGRMLLAARVRIMAWKLVDMVAD